MKSWLTIFNEETWISFLQMPTKICAYNDQPGKRFPVISIGDEIICYVSKLQVLSGILTVAGERYRSQDALYKGGIFPNRVPVSCEVALALAEAVPMSTLEGKLSFFPSGATGKDWGPFVRNSPRILHVPDAKALADAIRAGSLAKASAEKPAT